MRLALCGFACAVFFLPVVEKTIFRNSFQTWHNTPLVCKWKHIQVCLGALKTVFVFREISPSRIRRKFVKAIRQDFGKLSILLAGPGRQILLVCL